MNFEDLLKKMKSIDEGAQMAAPSSPEIPVEECGIEMMPHAPKQQDNVTMNVSMNGSGAGGIRDLMAILKNIEDGADEPEHDHGAEIIVGEPSEVELPVADEVYANEPNPHTSGIDSMTRTGNDMHSKGSEAEKVNGGGNPMGVDEALVSRLAQHYESIKEAKKEQEPEGTYSSKRQETDGQRIARIAKEKRQAEKKERMKNDFNAEMER